MNASNPPELSPGPDTDYPMSDRQIQQWIDACNHEPAKEVLREYLKLRTRSAPASAEGWPVGLHPVTTGLVQAFSAAMANKLRKAEQKYGYGVSWLNGDWEADCRAHLHDHIAKSDPLDVANYCAFMWHHGWSTASPPPPSADGVEG